MSALELAIRIGAAARRPASWIQLLKFGIVGGSGYVINLGVFALLAGNMGVHHSLAAIGAFCVAVMSNFFWNRHWTFEPGRIDDGWAVQQTHPMAGVAGGSAAQVTVPMWTVEDVDAAVALVREAGGTVIDEPSQQPYGKSAQCTDDQGTRFYLGEL